MSLLPFSPLPLILRTHNPRVVTYFDLIPFNLKIQLPPSQQFNTVNPRYIDRHLRHSTTSELSLKKGSKQFSTPPHWSMRWGLIASMSGTCGIEGSFSNLLGTLTSCVSYSSWVSWVGFWSFQKLWTIHALAWKICWIHAEIAVWENEDLSMYL